MYKIFDMRTFGLSHQIEGPTTVKLAFLQLIQLEPVLATFTVVGPLIWCDNPKVRMSKILYINNNNFHHLGRPQMCAGAWCLFRTWKPHSERLCTTSDCYHCSSLSVRGLPYDTILGVFWNSQELLLLTGTEIFKIDASWTEKLTIDENDRVSKILTPTVAWILTSWPP